MNIGQAIKTILAAGTTANYTTEINPVFGVQEVKPPFVAYSIQSNNPQYHKNTDQVYCDIASISIDCVASTALAVQNLAAAVRVDLENYKGDAAGTYVSGIWCISENDNFDVEAKMFYRTLTMEGMFS